MVKTTCFALVDCNNFYASCEKLFRPDLKHTPVVVLSNNDGCVVARSKEAKALGIKMAVPVFQIRQLMQQHGVVAFSSNYALYADISARVMTILQEMAPEVEVYSIDESFLDLSGLTACTRLDTFGHEIRDRVALWSGITVCVGIGPTKTLAKLANYAAKKFQATGGVVDLSDKARQRRLMALVPVDEVWGVGRRLSRQLNDMNIKTALDLADADPGLIRQRFSVVLARTVQELNGVSCLDLEQVAPTKQQIICSRTFGERIHDHRQMREAICDYTARAAEKLRAENRLAGHLTVFMQTSMYKAQTLPYAPSLSCYLSVPTSDSRVLLQQATTLLQRIWRDGYVYAKAGVMLNDFSDPEHFQPDLFSPAHNNPHEGTLMRAIDEVNQHQRGTVFFAGQGVNRQWSMKRQFLSPAYTTSWAGLRRVR